MATAFVGLRADMGPWGNGAASWRESMFVNGRNQAVVASSKTKPKTGLELANVTIPPSVNPYLSNPRGLMPQPTPGFGRSATQYTWEIALNLMGPDAGGPNQVTPPFEVKFAGLTGDRTFHWCPSKTVYEPDGNGDYFVKLSPGLGPGTLWTLVHTTPPGQLLVNPQDNLAPLYHNFVQDAIEAGASLVTPGTEGLLQPNGQFLARGEILQDTGPMEGGQAVTKRARSSPRDSTALYFSEIPGVLVVQSVEVDEKMAQEGELVDAVWKTHYTSSYQIGTSVYMTVMFVADGKQAFDIPAVDESALFNSDAVSMAALTRMTSQGDISYVRKPSKPNIKWATDDAVKAYGFDPTNDKVVQLLGKLYAAGGTDQALPLTPAIAVNWRNMRLKLEMRRVSAEHMSLWMIQNLDVTQRYVDLAEFVTNVTPSGNPLAVLFPNRYDAQLPMVKRPVWTKDGWRQYVVKGPFEALYSS